MFGLQMGRPKRYLGPPALPHLPVASLLQQDSHRAEVPHQVQVPPARGEHSDRKSPAVGSAWCVGRFSAELSAWVGVAMFPRCCSAVPPPAQNRPDSIGVAFTPTLALGHEGIGHPRWGEKSVSIAPLPKPAQWRGMPGPEQRTISGGFFGLWLKAGHQTTFFPPAVVTGVIVGQA